MADQVVCRHCRRQLRQLASALGRFWVHADGNAACDMTQATHPPRGTNATPEDLRSEAQ